jgi:glycosyltransferase involved in cell wall biosynthesis
MSGQEIRIAYFIDKLIEGGTELQLVEQINHLAGKGTWQILFCLQKGTVSDATAVKCRTEVLNVSSLMRLSTFLKLLKTAQTLKREKVSIVQTYFFDSTFFGVIASRIARVCRTISCRRDVGFWHTRVLVMIMRMLNLFCHRILVNSSTVKDSVCKTEKISPGRIDVIRNGISIRRYTALLAQRESSREALGISANEVCIGILANMSRQVKRVDLFVDAARILINNRKYPKFVVLGEGHLKTELQEKGKSSGLESHLFFLTKETKKDLVLAAIDIGVLTSDSEGLSNAIMEYMVCGHPTVASDIPGNRELIVHNENGLLFKKGDAVDLAEKLAVLINDPHARTAMGKHAMADIANFDWSLRTEEIVRYYQDVAVSRRDLHE